MKDPNPNILTDAERLWRESEAAACGLSFDEFKEILIADGQSKNYGLPSGQTASPKQRTAFFSGLCLADLVLARACAIGKDPAWTRFMAHYRERLFLAANSIAHNETLGYDIASSLFGELYGLNARHELRRSPLNSYSGSGTLMGWLRTILAQRYRDHHRRPKIEIPLEDHDAPAREPDPKPNRDELLVLGNAVEQAVEMRHPEDQYLLSAYYLDKRTQIQIGRLLGVSGATISRRHERLTNDLRKQTLRNLRATGMSKRKAEEALGTDPRDLDVNFSKLLRHNHSKHPAGEGGQ